MENVSIIIYLENILRKTEKRDILEKRGDTSWDREPESEVVRRRCNEKLEKT